MVAELVNPSLKARSAAPNAGGDLRHAVRTLVAEDGTRLFCQSLAPSGEPKAVLAMVHGYNSFSDWLLPMMAHLAESGFTCYAIDARGHGLSEGVPCHVFSFREYLLDVRALCSHVSSAGTRVPTFLFGYSLGGLMASLYAAAHPERVEGLVLAAPFFGPAFRIHPVLTWGSRLASRCFPTQRIPCRHPDLPPQITFRWWSEVQDAQRYFATQVERIQAPVLALHGERDTVSCPAAAQRTLEAMGSRGVTFRLLPDAAHPDLDPGNGAAWWPEVAGWLNARAT